MPNESITTKSKLWTLLAGIVFCFSFSVIRTHNHLCQRFFYLHFFVAASAHCIQPLTFIFSLMNFWVLFARRFALNFDKKHAIAFKHIVRMRWMSSAKQNCPNCNKNRICFFHFVRLVWCGVLFFVCSWNLFWVVLRVSYIRLWHLNAIWTLVAYYCINGMSLVEFNFFRVRRFFSLDRIYFSCCVCFFFSFCSFLISMWIYI